MKTRLNSPGLIQQPRSVRACLCLGDNNPKYLDAQFSDIIILLFLCSWAIQHVLGNQICHEYCYVFLDGVKCQVASQNEFSKTSSFAKLNALIGCGWLCVRTDMISELNFFSFCSLSLHSVSYLYACNFLCVLLWSAPVAV